MLSPQRCPDRNFQKILRQISHQNFNIRAALQCFVHFVEGGKNLNYFLHFGIFLFHSYKEFIKK